MSITERKIPTFGEQIVGVEYQPESTDKVQIIKNKFIELAEMMKETYDLDRSPARSLLFDHAIGELINAQMSIVKVVTYKTVEYVND